VTLKGLVEDMAQAYPKPCTGRPVKLCSVANGMVWEASNWTVCRGLTLKGLDLFPQRLGLFERKGRPLWLGSLTAFDKSLAHPGHFLGPELAHPPPQVVGLGPTQPGHLGGQPQNLFLKEQYAPGRAENGLLVN
jgi:hypothetical protein